MRGALILAVCCAGHLGSADALVADISDPALGLPARAAIAGDTPAAIALWRKLFFDERLSARGNVSCGSCHNPAKAMTDSLAVSQGDGGRRGTRNAPSLLNLRFNDSFFWDGRRSTLEEQALDPLFNPVEHGLRDASDLLARVAPDAGYRNLFADAYGVTPTRLDQTHVAKALASFVRSLVAGNSAFDRYYYKGERAALSESAARGFEIFTGRGRCATCHEIGDKHALFTDHKFHRLGVGTSAIADRLPELTRKLVDGRARGRSMDQLVLGDPALAELGRFAVTLDPRDIGKFRTPSLRNVALTAPYMHDGSVATLEDAVELEIYYRGTESGRPLILTPQERADLVEFMRALTSASLPEAARKPSAPHSQ